MDIRRVSALGDAERTAIFERDAGIGDVRESVEEILTRVREEGDTAIRELTRKYDDVDLAEFDVTAEAKRAYDQIDPETRVAIEQAADNIRAFHERQMPTDWREEFGGRELGRRFRPIQRVGVYIPRGVSGYPSSALVAIVPATVAGVSEIVVTTPPSEPVNETSLAAMHTAGADTIYGIGGPAAIAALAYGTESVDSVPKIVGPGGKRVSAAKAAVRGDVAIDFIAGPSESLTIADRTANPAYVASDMVGQGEHAPNNCVAAVTDDRDTAEEIVTEIERQVSNQEREDVIRCSLEEAASGVFLVESLAEATAFAERYAPEHLSIQADNEDAILERVENAASVFLGPYTPVAAGDYGSGTNAILPTNGLPRMTGGLSVDVFMRAMTVQRLSKDALEDLRETVTTLAEAEGFEGHAESVRKRLP